MNCEELVTYLSDYIDQDLDRDLRRDAEQHLATCQNCRIVLDTTQQMIFLYRQSGRQSIPIERREKLYARLQTAFQARKQTTEKNPPEFL